jgi:hypothetical protein
MTKEEQWVIKCMTDSVDMELTSKQRIDGARVMFANAVGAAFVAFAEKTEGETHFDTILEEEVKALVDVCFQVYEMHKTISETENVTSIFQGTKK